MTEGWEPLPERMEQLRRSGPYTKYDGLSVLHATEVDLPLLDPYAACLPAAALRPGRAVTVRGNVRNPGHGRGGMRS